MALRRFYDYNQDPLGSARPTRRKTLFRDRSGKLVSGFSGPTANYTPVTTDEPVVSTQEILDATTKRFNAAPVSYKTDPVTGKTIATRSIAKQELPSELAGISRFRRFFSDPQDVSRKTFQDFRRGQQQTVQANDDLSFSWILPRGARTGSRFNQRRVPVSDEQRQAGYRFGATIGNENVATPNPNTFFPKSSFQLPTRSFGGTNEPVFGGVVDYTTGQYNIPPEPGTLDTQGTFGRFGRGQKTTPKLKAGRFQKPFSLATATSLAAGPQAQYRDYLRKINAA